MAMWQGEAGGLGPESYGIPILGKALKPYFQLGLIWKEAMAKVMTPEQPFIYQVGACTQDNHWFKKSQDLNQSLSIIATPNPSHHKHNFQM